VIGAMRRKPVELWVRGQFSEPSRYAGPCVAGEDSAEQTFSLGVLLGQHHNKLTYLKPRRRGPLTARLS
jgi:hypothetical protein